MRVLPPRGLRSSLAGGELLFDKILGCAGAAAIAFGGSRFVSAGAVCDRGFVDCDELTELIGCCGLPSRCVGYRVRRVAAQADFRWRARAAGALVRTRIAQVSCIRLR